LENSKPKKRAAKRGSEEVNRKVKLKGTCPSDELDNNINAT
jgi:hypothetical protein